MRKVKILLVVAFAFVVGACKKREEPRPASDPQSETPTKLEAAGSGVSAGSAGSAGSGSNAAAGSDAAPVADASGVAAETSMAHHAGNCPSTVLGATTSAVVKAKTVVVTVSSKDKDAIAAIQKRADEMLKARQDTKVGDTHDRQGSKGGKDGLCPIVIPEGGKATAKNDKSGVVITIAGGEKPAELKAEIDRRIAKAADWVKANIQAGDKGNEGGVGGGKGNDGSNHSGKGDGKGQERKAGEKHHGAGGGGGSGSGDGKGDGKH